MSRKTAPRVQGQLLQILDASSAGSRQVHDADIVPTMIAHDIRKLLTHNVGDFQRCTAWIKEEKARHVIRKAHTRCAGMRLRYFAQPTED
jgi:hypothetical protein